MTKKTPTKKIDLTMIASLIVEGIAKWFEAGEIIVAALDAEPGCMDRICEVTGLSQDILRRFEQIGRREIYPQILASTSPGMLRLSACPYREQKMYCEKPVEVVVMHDGGPDTLLVAVNNLTPTQARQAFSRDHVRTNAEQRAWIESEREKKVERALADNAVKSGSDPFEIKKGKIRFRKDTEFTRPELANILARMG